jgi:glycosyltransferase involved in cell wall biosynthesis
VKIAIDLQACQTPGSRRRGIGRYSRELAKGIVRNRGSHRVHFLLNEAFGDQVDTVHRELGASQEATFETYRLLGFGASQGEDRKKLQRINDEVLNWRYACSGADALHISSVFEGWLAGDAHVTASIADVPGMIRSATLYDLIPLLLDATYLTPSTRRAYFARLGVFQQLDLIFAISESARRDAIGRLNVSPERIVNIGGAASSAFHRVANLNTDRVAEMLSRHRLARRFVLYTGGIDHRKNLDFLLRAYAALPNETRQEVQLVIVCEMSPEEHRDLLQRAATSGIAGQAVFPGYVSDEELNLLYNLCELFVFPSLYEGFGLPVLEAMTCGACVLASNTSSMPEILGQPEMLFDPADAGTLTRMMHELLSAHARRQELAAANIERSGSFSWDNVARTVIEAMEDVHARRRTACASSAPARRLRVALVSPLPPQRSGIADYCASMLPHWNRHFEITLLADGYVPALDRVFGSYPIMSMHEFRQEALRFDSILYHVGNSPYHAAMYALLSRYPGIVVMHDFYLSGLLQWMEHHDRVPGMFQRELVLAHGADAVHAVDALARGELDADHLRIRYAVSRRVVKHARGLIFHSRFAQQLAVDAYPDLIGVPSCVVPQASFAGPPDTAERNASRGALGIGTSDLLVCAFGFLVETKDNELLLAALSRHSIAGDARIRVAFVGELEQGSLKARIDALLAGHPMRDRIRITGYVDDREYMRYLAACDIGVSVRSNSRGETSAAMLKQLAVGCATIVSDYAAMSELPDDVACKIPPSDPDALTRALKRLVDDPLLRNRFGQAARRWIDESSRPAQVANQYAAAVSMLTELDRARCAGRLTRRIAEIADDENLDERATAGAADAIASGLATHPASARWLAAHS